MNTQYPYTAYLEQSMGTLLKPVEPNPEFVQRLQQRLTNPGRVIFEQDERHIYPWLALGGAIGLSAVILGFVYLLVRRAMAR